MWQSLQESKVRRELKTCEPHLSSCRFQRHEYANVEIIQTEKKGFGLRAASTISSDSFVYEYIGEVVEQKEFMKRMQQYRDEHIKHFYFMMLQREEFLDATRKGGVARFINHSCNPNCFVSKWHVGKHMRMGIFAKRDIGKGEELTFNYNVDRYGNDAQPCYCGEPNCVGTIGGKTQTDIGGMDQLFIDALGIADEVDQLEARGTRKKKSRHLDEDYKPTLRPMVVDDVAKVMTAIRQATSNRSILEKLLTRIHMTQDIDVQRALVRLHGFVLMASILDEWHDDKEILLLAMGSLARWPLVARNKVVDSGVDKQVQGLTESGEEAINSLAKELLSAWDALDMSYRIARKEVNNAKSTLFEHRRNDDLADESVQPLDQAYAPNTVSDRLESVAPKPLGTKQTLHTASVHRPSYREGGHRAYDSSFRHSPTGHADISQSASRKQHAPSIEEIIKRANEAELENRKNAEEAAARGMAAAAAAAAQLEALRNTRLTFSSKRRSSAKQTSHVDKKRRTAETSSRRGIEAAEKRLRKLLGEVVVRCMSARKDDLERSVFKKHARELTNIIVEKEKKNPKMWPPSSESISSYLKDGLSTEKKTKVKAFAKEYVNKLVAHKTGKSKETAKDSDALASSTRDSVSPRESDHQDEDDDDDDDDNDASSTHPSDAGGGQEEDGDRSLTSVSPTTSSKAGVFAPQLDLSTSTAESSHSYTNGMKGDI